MPFPMLVPAFFFSSWLLMIFWGMVSPGVDVKTIGYPTAMLVTIGLWLVVFPLSGRGRGKPGMRKKWKKKEESGDSGSSGGDFMRGFQQMRSGGGSGDGSNSSETIADDEISLTSSFSGISRTLTSQNFRGGSVSASFGGVRLDLTGAKLAEDGARLDVQALVGGVEIRVPNGWNVKSEMSTTFGGVKDERSETGIVDGAPTLVLAGAATAGGISIKN